MKGAVGAVFGNAKGFLFNHKGTKAQMEKGTGENAAADRLK